MSTDSGKMVWFPCYVNDILGSMRWKCMTATERGAYWQLILWQMQSDDGHLPNDIKILSVLADCELHQNSCVIDAFPVQDNGKRANIRALKEWQKRTEIGESRSQAASTAAHSRWQRQRMRDASDTHKKRNASKCTSTSTSTSTDTSKTTSKKKLATDKPSRERNYVMDTLAAIECENLDEVTSQLWGKHAKALSVIRSVAPDVTPDEIKRRAANYKSHFDGAALTSTALAAHWGKCATAKNATRTKFVIVNENGVSVRKEVQY